MFDWFRDKESSASQLASWLPYIAYIEDEQIFVNRDGMGFMLEVVPQSGADERMVEVLLSLHPACPPKTGDGTHAAEFAGFSTQTHAGLWPQPFGPKRPCPFPAVRLPRKRATPPR